VQHEQEQRAQQQQQQQQQQQRQLLLQLQLQRQLRLGSSASAERGSPDPRLPGLRAQVATVDLAARQQLLQQLQVVAPHLPLLAT